MKRVCLCQWSMSKGEKMKIKYNLLLAFFVLSLTACSNPYYKFYRGDRYERNYPPSCVYLGSISSADGIEHYLDGYSIMGESGFSSTTNDYSVDKMIDACNAIGGDAAVILEPEYLGTENVVKTYYTYQPGRTYTINSTSQVSGNYSGNVYGRYDRVGSYDGSYQGSENTQTTIRSNGRLEAHPYMTTASRYAFRAVYLKKKQNATRDAYTYSKRRGNNMGCIANDERDIVLEKDLCSGIYPFGKGYVYWDSKIEKCKTYSLDNVIPYCRANHRNSFLYNMDPYEAYANANVFLHDSILVYMQNLYRWGNYISKKESELFEYTNREYGPILLWEWIKRMDNESLYNEWIGMSKNKKRSVLDRFYSQIETIYAEHDEKNWFKIKKVAKQEKK